MSIEARKQLLLTLDKNFSLTQVHIVFVVKIREHAHMKIHEEFKDG